MATNCATKIILDKFRFDKKLNFREFCFLKEILKDPVFGSRYYLSF
jgi:hypothetical protein